MSKSSARCRAAEIKSARRRGSLKRAVSHSMRLAGLILCISPDQGLDPSLFLLGMISSQT